MSNAHSTTQFPCAAFQALRTSIVEYVARAIEVGVPGCAGILLAACTGMSEGTEPLQSSNYEVRVTARRDTGQSLPEVEFWRDEQFVGKTDAAGELRLSLRGSEGERLALKARCPPGYVSPEQAIEVGLRRMAPGSQSPNFEAECRSLVHSFVVGIRAEHGAGLSVLRLGQVVAKTDVWGVAHFAFDAKPDQSIAITFDTSSASGLRPESPTLTFVTPDRDELVLLEQRFTAKPKIVVRPRRAVPIEL